MPRRPESGPPALKPGDYTAPAGRRRMAASATVGATLGAVSLAPMTPLVTYETSVSRGPVTRVLGPPVRQAPLSGAAGAVAPRTVIAPIRSDCTSTERLQPQARLRPQRVSITGTLAQMFTFAHVPWFPQTGDGSRRPCAAPRSGGPDPAGGEVRALPASLHARETARPGLRIPWRPGLSAT